jgi:hypothetical protein
MMITMTITKKQLWQAVIDIGFWGGLIFVLILTVAVCSPAHANINITPYPTETPTITYTFTPIPTTTIPTVTYTQLPTPSTTIVVQPTNLTSPSVEPIKRIEQGETVYLGDTYDISGVVGWATYLAWYNSYEPEPGVTPWTLQLPNTKKGYYMFYIDPLVFSDKLGDWYQYYGNYESAGNLRAFRVAPASEKPITYMNVTENKTIAENKTAEKPWLPVRHVADYLIARGDSFNITVNSPTTMWLFGTNTGIYDTKSFNGTIQINASVMNSLEPGRYRLLLQTYGQNIDDFTMRYNVETQKLEWFDFKNFLVYKWDVSGYSPQVLYNKIIEIRPQLIDTFSEYTFELQEPSVSITQIDPRTVSEYGHLMSGQEYVNNQTYLDIRGYTNVAPGTKLYFVIDEDKQTPLTINRSTITGEVWGEYGGDMRYFVSVVPVDKYGAGIGQHEITVTTALGGSSIVPYYVYDAPVGTYVRDKPIRYIAGRIGDTEFVQTPTPEIIVKEVTKQVTVIRTVTIPVTPSKDFVRAQQDAVITDKIWFYGKWVLGLIGAGLVVGYIGWVVVRARRGKKE